MNTAPMERLCENRAFANQLLGAFEAFKRAKRNGRDPLPDIIEYNLTGREHWTPNDIARKAHYGDLNKVFSFTRRPDNRTFREYLKERYADTLNPVNDESPED